MEDKTVSDVKEGIPMITETKRLRIRPLLESDLAAYCHLLTYPAMATANGSTPVIAADLLATWFEADRHSPFAFAVVERRHQRMVGAVLFYHHQASDNPGYDLGYFLAPQLWGQGLMPEAVTASLKFISQRHQQLPVWAACLASNPRSQRVLTKLGFHLIRTEAATATRAAKLWFRLPGDQMAK